MQLIRLSIPHFRNLDGLDISFAQYLVSDKKTHHGWEQKPPEGQPIRAHALIGQNGTGKSNVMEALITIFRDVDLGKDAAFDYELEYQTHHNHIRIKADTSVQKRPFVWVNGNKQSQNHLVENPSLLPSHIFAYYSGRNERMEALFQEHQRRFNRRQEITAEEVLPAHILNQLTDSDQDRETMAGLRDQEERKRARLGDDRLRRLFYCRGGHSQLVLLACLLSDDPVFRQLLEELGIERLESALFVLKQPYRLRRKMEEDDILQGDPRFWYARGNVVSEFLDKLWQVSWAPVQQEVSRQIDFRGRTEKQKQLYCYVPSADKLRELGELIGSTDSFFRYAEGAYIGDLIEEIRITVKKRDSDGGMVSFTHLSEGELQLLTVLGLMRLTDSDDCLFLLDEPDTHLNPIWKLRYFEQIQKVMQAKDQQPFENTSQVLITTHDPMMIGSLKREQVHIIRRMYGETHVDLPDTDPQGMGVTGLLRSELFGLSSTLDSETERRLYRRNELFAKGSNKTRDEKEEYDQLCTELSDLGFSTSDFRDPMYAQFVQKMAKHTKFQKPILTPEEQAEQDRIADEIISKILAERG